MRIYLGSSQMADMASGAARAVERKNARPLRFLFSYFYFRDLDVEAVLKECFGDRPVELFADSGAFSAFTQGKPIVEAEYVEWVRRWRHLFVAAAGPDIIGEPAKTIAATERMLAAVEGLPVLPTFHVGEDWRFLQACVGMSPYIALGGMVPHVKTKTTILGPWLRKAFSQIPETTKVHGFGLTVIKMLRDFPWYSVDSSSWTIAFRYAILWLFDETKGKHAQVLMGDPKSLLANRELIETYGLRVTQLRSHDYDRDLLSGVSVESWQRAEAWLARRSKWQR